MTAVSDSKDGMMVWQATELEQVPCDLCGATRATPLYLRPDGLQAVQCAECGLCYISPRPCPALVHRLYTMDYFLRPAGTAEVGFQDYLAPPNVSNLRRLCQEKLDKVFHDAPMAGLKVLEVGCASGEACSLLRQRGAQPTGIDLSEEIVAEAHRRFPEIPFRVGEITLLSPDEVFDAVLAFEVIEHVASPLRFMRQVHAHLSEGGVFAVTTPNLSCGKKIGLDRWSGFQMSFEHFYFFTLESLAQCANQAGFQLCEWYSGGDGGVSARENVLRAFARSVLRTVGLLPLVQRLRHGPPRSPLSFYSPGKDRHNLLAVFRKTPNRAPPPTGGAEENL